MYDAGKILIGIVVFIALVTTPIWINMAGGAGAKAPTLEKPLGEQHCVETTEYMKENHMQLLIDWRESVVRDGNRTYISHAYGDDPHKGHFEMSLSETCLKCHSNKANFCEKCHDYVGVDVFCWDCHHDRKEQ